MEIKLRDDKIDRIKRFTRYILARFDEKFKNQLYKIKSKD